LQAIERESLTWRVFQLRNRFYLPLSPPTSFHPHLPPFQLILPLGSLTANFLDRQVSHWIFSNSDLALSSPLVQTLGVFVLPVDLQAATRAGLL
jgi:hypothetical protein